MNYIIKVTDGCNMHCKYCCVGDKNEYGIISEEQLCQNMKFAAENSTARKETAANIIFHGGEPTLVKAEIYRKAIENIVHEYPEFHFCWKMQTNGFLIPESFIDLFAEYHFGIGVSLDGFASYHDSIRLDCNGNATFDRIIKNILHMKERGISVSVLMVVTAMTEKEYSFLDFLNENHISVKINPLIECGEAEQEQNMWLKPLEYADYMIGVFEYMIRNKLTIDIEPLNNIFHMLIHPEYSAECTFSGNCFSKFLAIDYKGNLYPCGRFCDSHMFGLGNTAYTTVPVNPHEDHRSFLSDKCHSCHYEKICHGGCPFMVWNQGEKKNPMCQDYQKLFDYLIDDGIRLIQSQLSERREQLYNETFRKHKIRTPDDEY